MAYTDDGGGGSGIDYGDDRLPDGRRIPGGDDDEAPSLSLVEVTTTRYRLAPTSAEHSHPTFRVRISNDGTTSTVATVRLWFGSQFVRELTGTVAAGETETLSTKIRYRELATRGVVPGNDYPLHAFLQSGPSWDKQEVKNGTMHVLSDPIPGKGESRDDGDSDDESTPDTSPSAPAGSSEALAVLPPMGPLTSTQTTLAVGLGFALVVVLL
jgi:hypothetical protein